MWNEDKLTPEQKAQLEKDREQINKWGAWTLGLVVVIRGGFIIAESNRDPSSYTASTPDQVIQKHSIRMGVKCKREIKDLLKNPGSFREEKTTFWPSMEPYPAEVMVQIQYRAKNSFGGYVKGRGVCHADSGGSILKAKILE